MYNGTVFNNSSCSLQLLLKCSVLSSRTVERPNDRTPKNSTNDLSFHIIRRFWTVLLLPSSPLLLEKQQMLNAAKWKWIPQIRLCSITQFINHVQESVRLRPKQPFPLWTHQKSWRVWRRGQRKAVNDEQQIIPRFNCRIFPIKICFGNKIT